MPPNQVRRAGGRHKNAPGPESRCTAMGTNAPAPFSAASAAARAQAAAGFPQRNRGLAPARPLRFGPANVARRTETTGGPLVVHSFFFFFFFFFSAIPPQSIEDTNLCFIKYRGGTVGPCTRPSQGSAAGFSRQGGGSETSELLGRRAKRRRCIDPFAFLSAPSASAGAVAPTVGDSLLLSSTLWKPIHEWALLSFVFPAGL